MSEARLPTVDCWRIDLDSPLPPGAEHWIAAAEHARADRFRFAHLQRRYRATRAALRVLLARELDLSPADVRFVRSARGKPELDPAHDSPLHFNLTHSEHVAWVALGRQELGIDLEVLGREVRTLDSLIHRVTTPTEAARLLAMPEDLRELAFLLMWTRKESTLKAWGEGITGMGSLNTLDSQLPEIGSLTTFLRRHHPERPDGHTARRLPDRPQATDHALPQTRIHYPAVRLPSADGPRPPLYATTFDLGSELITVSSPAPFRATIRHFSY